MSEVGTIRLLQRLSELGATRSMVCRLFPNLSPRILLRLERQGGIEGRWSNGCRWNQVRWRRMLTEQTNILNAAIIIQTWQTLYSRSTDQNRRHRYALAVVDTAYYYLNYHDEPRFSADGVLAVIESHQKGESTEKFCRTCQTRYWLFQPHYPCPVCHPAQLSICRSCGKEFYVPLEQRTGGRPRRYCLDCSPQVLRTGTS